MHRVLGPGFLEGVYEEALCIELGVRGIAFDRQRTVKLGYKGCAAGAARIDLVVEGKLIVELKAVERLLALHVSQTISYLRATNLALGLLINFNSNTLLKGVILSQ